MAQKQDTLLSYSDEELDSRLGVHIEQLLAFASGDAGIDRPAAPRFGAAGLASRNYALFAFDHPELRALAPAILSGKNVLVDKKLFERGDEAASPAFGIFLKAVSEAEAAEISADEPYLTAIKNAPDALPVAPSDLAAVCSHAEIRDSSLQALDLGDEPSGHPQSAAFRAAAYSGLSAEAVSCAAALGSDLAAAPASSADDESARIASAGAAFARKAFGQEAGCLSGPSELAFGAFVRAVESSGAAPRSCFPSGPRNLLSSEARSALCHAAFQAIVDDPNSIQDEAVREQLISAVSDFHLLRKAPPSFDERRPAAPKPR